MKLASRALLLLALQSLAVGAFAAGAHADDKPICGRPEILSFATDRYRNNDAHIKLIPQTATEFATSRADIVICAVTVQVGLYDSADRYARPLILSESRYFEVKRLTVGFEVSFDGF